MALNKVRNGLEMSLPPDSVQRLLYAVLDYLREKTNYESDIELHQVLIDDMNLIAQGMTGKNPGWQAGYIKSAKSPNFSSGKLFKRVLESLAAELDGAPAIQMQGKFVTVFVINQVKENSQIAGDSIMCKNEGCFNWFVPNVWNRGQCYSCSPPKKGGK